MKYVRMPIEIESPEQMGYGNVRYNLTESSVSDQLLGDIKLDIHGTLLAYGHHQGNENLRVLISQPHGLGVNDVLTTAGAAAALFIVSSSLLTSRDHILVMKPNYATNIETPKAIGCEIDFIELGFENGFRPDMEKVKKQIKPNTRFISITTPHNPTGMCLTELELMQFIKLAEEKNIWLVVDETYRGLSYGPATALAAGISNKVISISSLSKAYGLPGLRMGWITCRDTKLQELFLAAKEQIFVCHSVLDETVALQFMQQSEPVLKNIHEKNRKNFELVKTFMHNEKRLEWVEPAGGVVCFPRIKNEKADTEKFYQTLNQQYQTFVGPGHWFDMDKRYFRIGYGWPTTGDLKTGLENISRSLDVFNH